MPDLRGSTITLVPATDVSLNVSEARWLTLAGIQQACERVADDDCVQRTWIRIFIPHRIT